MIGTEHTGNMHGILSLKGLNNHKPRILLILSVDLLLRQASGAGDLPVKIIRRRGLITYTWGNVSGIDRASGLISPAPSPSNAWRLYGPHSFLSPPEHLFRK